MRWTGNPSEKARLFAGYGTSWPPPIRVEYSLG